MLKIPRKQVLDRWDSLPDNLREALCSEQNANILWAACEKEHIPKEKIYTIATLAGDVILGFSHSYDLAQEIRNELGVNPAIAEDIVSEVNRKIFGQIRSDLEKVYSPPTEEAEKTEEEVLDLRGRISEVEPVIEAAKEFKIQGAEMPELIITEEKPKIIPTVEPLKAEQPKIIPAGEKKPEEKKEEKAPLLGEGPLIIHKEAELKPFGESKKSLGGLFGFLRKDKGTEVKPSAVKAEVQMGLNGKPPELSKTEPIIRSSTEPIKPRVVHYSEFKTPISPFPQDVNKDVSTDKRGLYTEMPELIITEEEPKTIPTAEPLKAEQPKIIPIEEKKPGQVNVDKNLFESASNLRESAFKGYQPPENLPVANRIESPIINRTEPSEMNQIKPSAANPIQPPQINAFKPSLVSAVKPPTADQIKPYTTNKVEPFVIEPSNISKANRVEPPIKKIPEVKVEEKTTSKSRFRFFDFLKIKKPVKPEIKNLTIIEPSIKPRETIKIEPKPFMSSGVKPFVTSEIKPPVATEVKPQMISRVEPPIINKTEPHMINKIEPIAASRVEPKIVKIPEIKVEEKKSPASHLGFFDFLKIKFGKSSKSPEKKQLINQPLTKSAAASKIEPRVVNPSTPLMASSPAELRTSRVEPPKSNSSKPEEEVINLSVFK